MRTTKNERFLKTTGPPGSESGDGWSSGSSKRASRMTSVSRRQCGCRIYTLRCSVLMNLTLIRSPRLGVEFLKIPSSNQPSSTPPRYHPSTCRTLNHPLWLPFWDTRKSFKTKGRELSSSSLVPSIYKFRPSHVGVFRRNRILPQMRAWFVVRDCSRGFKSREILIVTVPTFCNIRGFAKQISLSFRL
jgi:hypothetical protein